MAPVDERGSQFHTEASLVHNAPSVTLPEFRSDKYYFALFFVCSMDCTAIEQLVVSKTNTTYA